MATTRNQRTSTEGPPLASSSARHMRRNSSCESSAVSAEILSKQAPPSSPMASQHRVVVPLGQRPKRDPMRHSTNSSTNRSKLTIFKRTGENATSQSVTVIEEEEKCDPTSGSLSPPDAESGQRVLSPSINRRLLGLRSPEKTRRSPYQNRGSTSLPTRGRISSPSPRRIRRESKINDARGSVSHRPIAPLSAPSCSAPSSPSGVRKQDDELPLKGRSPLSPRRYAPSMANPTSSTAANVRFEDSNDPLCDAEERAMKSSNTRLPVSPSTLAREEVNRLTPIPQSVKDRVILRSNSVKVLASPQGKRRESHALSSTTGAISSSSRGGGGRGKPAQLERSVSSFTPGKLRNIDEAGSDQRRVSPYNRIVCNLLQQRTANVLNQPKGVQPRGLIVEPRQSGTVATSSTSTISPSLLTVEGGEHIVPLSTPLPRRNPNILSGDQRRRAKEGPLSSSGSNISTVQFPSGAFGSRQNAMSSSVEEATKPAQDPPQQQSSSREPSPQFRSNNSASPTIPLPKPIRPSRDPSSPTPMRKPNKVSNVLQEIDREFAADDDFMEKVETHSDDEDDEATLEELLEKEERLERWEAGPSAQTRDTHEALRALDIELPEVAMEFSNSDFSVIVTKPALQEDENESRRAMVRHDTFDTILEASPKPEFTQPEQIRAATKTGDDKPFQHALSPIPSRLQPEMHGRTTRRMTLKERRASKAVDFEQWQRRTKRHKWEEWEKRIGGDNASLKESINHWVSRKNVNQRRNVRRFLGEMSNSELTSADTEDDYEEESEDGTEFRKDDRASGEGITSSASRKRVRTARTAKGIEQSDRPTPYWLVKDWLTRNTTGHSPISRHPLLEFLLEPDFLLLDGLAETVANKDSNKLCFALMRIFDGCGRSLDIIAHFLEDEINNTTSQNTLFRSNSFTSKLMTSYARISGGPFLKKIIGNIVKEVSFSGLQIELDPRRMKEGMTVENQVELLLDWGQRFLNMIIVNIDHLPSTFSRICALLSARVGKKHPQAINFALANFLFLRYMCPAIVAPEAYGLLVEPPSAVMRRTLLWVSKLIQNLANGVKTTKEETMGIALPRFREENIERMEQFFEDVVVIREKPEEVLPTIPVSLVEESLSIVHRQLMSSLEGMKRFMIDADATETVTYSLKEDIETVITKSTPIVSLKCASQMVVHQSSPLYKPAYLFYESMIVKDSFVARTVLSCATRGDELADSILSILHWGGRDGISGLELTLSFQRIMEREMSSHDTIDQITGGCLAHLLPAFFKLYGSEYVRKLWAPILLQNINRDFCFDSTESPSSRGNQEALQNIIDIFRRLLNALIGSLEECSRDLMEVVECYQLQLNEKFGDEVDPYLSPKLLCKSLFSAALAYPTAFQLLSEVPSHKVRRGCLLLAKTFDALVDDRPFTEADLIPLNDLVESHRGDIQEYFCRMVSEEIAFAPSVNVSFTDQSYIDALVCIHRFLSDNKEQVMAALGDEQNTETVTYCPFDRLGAVVALYRFRIKRKTMRLSKRFGDAYFKLDNGEKMGGGNRHAWKSPFSSFGKNERREQDASLGRLHRG